MKIINTVKGHVLHRQRAEVLAGRNCCFSGSVSPGAHQEGAQRDMALLSSTAALAGGLFSKNKGKFKQMAGMSSAKGL